MPWFGVLVTLLLAALSAAASAPPELDFRTDEGIAAVAEISDAILLNDESIELTGDAPSVRVAIEAGAYPILVQSTAGGLRLTVTDDDGRAVLFVSLGAPGDWSGTLSVSQSSDYLFTIHSTGSGIVRVG
jgi:hypothetical protein